MYSILIVDDDRPTRDTLRFVLEDAGYLVQDAPDGRTALTKLTAAATPFVALLDLLMPGMDGLELLRTVVADPNLWRHRYIGMTAAVGPVGPEAEALLHQLHGALLLKPFDMDTLLAAVTAACDSIIVSGDGYAGTDGHTPSQA
ncbi:MAG TPA: response regulator [Ktedonobacterales bacterium]|jgi:CheY-like chemotaxis protein|nr:response regulator [Ktedonobacterales bacterium]